MSRALVDMQIQMFTGAWYPLSGIRVFCVVKARTETTAVDFMSPHEPRVAQMYRIIELL